MGKVLAISSYIGVICGCALLALCTVVLSPSVLDEEVVWGHFCVDNNWHNNTEGRFYSDEDGEGACKAVDLYWQRGGNHSIDDLVAVFRMPGGRGDNESKYSRLLQTLTATLHADTTAHTEDLSEYLVFAVDVVMDARLAYRDADGGSGEWKPYAASVERRRLSCNETAAIGWHSCHVIPVFALDTLHHESYLLNVKLSSDDPRVKHIRRMWLKVTTRNERFAALWMGLKAVYFACSACVVAYYIIRARNSKFEFFAKMIASLGIALSFLNMPIDFITFAFDWPAVALLKHIRLSLFYTCQFFFFHIFIDEHKLIPANGQSGTKRYWPQFVGVVVPCIILFCYDVYQIVQHLSNPFYQVSEAKPGVELYSTYAAIAFGGLSLLLHTLYLQYHMLQCCKNRRNRDNPGQTNRYARAIIVCSAITVVEIGKGQYIDGVRIPGYNRWDDNIEQRGTFSEIDIIAYVVWNSYIFILFKFYMPILCKEVIPADI